MFISCFVEDEGRGDRIAMDDDWNIAQLEPGIDRCLEYSGSDQCTCVLYNHSSNLES